MSGFLSKARGALAALMLAVFAAAPAAAQDFPDELGPPVGETIPHSLELQDQTGAVRGGVADLAGPEGLVLLFNRSLDWCPYCQAQIIEINGAADRIRERGYGIAVVTYDDVSVLAQFAEHRGIGLDLLSDPGSVAIDAFGIRNMSYRDNPRAWGVPHPVIFVLSPDGVIRAKLYEEDFRQRPPVESLLAAIDAAG